jgi:hypothetical protein
LEDSVELLVHRKPVGSKAHRLVVHFPGMGEAGNTGTIDKLYKWGMPNQLRPGTTWQPSGTFVAVFAPSAFPTPAQVNKILDQNL